MAKARIQPRFGNHLNNRPARIFSQRQRVLVVGNIARVLAGWRLSHFELEAQCRHGLRQGLCEMGHGWQQSDDEASEVVREALLILGAVRPSWLEGQREHTVSQENCNYCGDSLNEEQRNMHDRFCSTGCAHSALKRDYETRVWEDELGRRAIYILQRESIPRTTCVQCARDFQPATEGAVHCSNACARAGWQVKLPDKCCEQCGSVFHPHTAADRFCSVTCYGQAKRVLPNMACLHCHATFRPATSTRKYCCHECSRLHRVALLEPRPCLCCCNTFAPNLETALYCSPRCKSNYKSRLRRHKP